MSAEWQTLTLQEVCDKITDGSHFSPKAMPNGYPMASVKDLTRFGVVLENCKTISKEDFDNLVSQGCSPSFGDVLIAKDGNSALDTVCVYRQQDKIVLLSSVAILRPNEKILPSYLNYYLDCPTTRHFLKENFRSGSAIPRVVLRDFKRVPITIPTLPEQRAIAHILSTLDDKIENNRRMNATLEAMAQALFKSWFVDFDPVRAKAEGREPEGMDAATAALFPDRLVDSELGEVPEGWEVKTLGETCDSRYGKILKKDELLDSGYPVWNGYQISGYHSEFMFENTEVSITCRGVGGTGKVYLIPPKAWVTNLAIVIVPKENYEIDRYYLYRYLLNSDTSLLITGSAQHQITIGTLSTFQFFLPPANLLKAFSNIVGTYEIKKKSNTDQSLYLANIRDTLLPKLISGELRVPEAEEMMDAL
jgi:type I restriction enzyme S subunit